MMSITFANTKEASLEKNKTTYLLNDKCGSFSVGLPIFGEVDGNYLIVNKESPDDTTKKLTLTLTCDTNGLAINNELVLFNNNTGQWELNPKQWDWYTDENDKKEVRKSLNIDQLNSKNGHGWIVTQIAIGSKDDDYVKLLFFCLFNSDKTKKLCGEGDAQYIQHRENLGTLADDYEPIIKKIIESIRFLPDNN